jgi:glutaredoxin
LKIVVYGRPECHLCDEALDGIEALVSGLEGVEVESVDIERDDDLMRLYLERIPVVVADGETVSELVFDPAPLRSLLGIT